MADVPRVACDEHGVIQITVPWSDPKSRFTALFEALVIDWLKEASFAAVARQLCLSLDQVAGIQDRAVRRGLARRKTQRPRRIGIDETSLRKGAEYITVANDLDQNRVLWVGDNRRKQTPNAFYAELGAEGCTQLQSVAMDMWAPCIASTREHVPNADRRILFGKFHIAQHLGRAVDEVRRAENKELVSQGDGRLKKTKYLWLTNPDRMSRRRREGFASLRDSQLDLYPNSLKSTHTNP
ncbi:MAG: transposase [Myxococcota bacterium]|nr:transposase [Myxococcota bacterium]MDP7073157.1 transposase [Myxococcota bacterium]MDP7431393.1 transposase [Myxococcota bacterium]